MAIIAIGESIALTSILGTICVAIIKFKSSSNENSTYVSKELCEQINHTVAEKHQDLRAWTGDIAKELKETKEIVNNIDKNVAVLLTRRRDIVKIEEDN